jgi:hypothetical protein
VSPARAAAAHQSLLHFVGQSAWWAKIRFGGRHDGFFNRSYQSPGRNHAPVSAARKLAAMKQAGPMIEEISI